MKTTALILGLLIVAALCAYPQNAKINGVPLQTLTLPCAATPPVAGLAGTVCTDTSGQVWVCNNGASACTTAAQWVQQNPTTVNVSSATTFTDTGAVNAIAFTDTAISAYSANLTFVIVPAHTNTGAATITVTGSGGALATLPLQRNGAALTGGEYLIGQPFPVVCGVSACQIAAFGKLNLLVLPVATKTASYGAQNTDYLILADPTSAAVTITAPLAPVLGQIFVVKTKAYSATHDVVVSGGSALIDGQTSYTVTYMQSLTFMWDGTAWWII